MEFFLQRKNFDNYNNKKATGKRSAFQWLGGKYSG